MSSDLLRMERGDLRHNWCIGSLLADYMQDIGAVRPNASGAVVQAPYLSPGFSDFGKAGVCRGRVGCVVGCGFVGWVGRLDAGEE